MRHILFLRLHSGVVWEWEWRVEWDLGLCALPCVLHCALGAVAAADRGTVVDAMDDIFLVGSQGLALCLDLLIANLKTLLIHHEFS